jgi:GntR family transcriptional regulator
MKALPAPLYARIEAALRARIAAGEWAPGAALPTEPTLAMEYGISQGTLRRALAALEAQRVIERRQGAGTYVAEATSARALFHFFRVETPDGARPVPTSIAHRLEARPARAEEAAALALPARERVVALERLRLVDGRPVILEAITLPVTLFAGFALPLGQVLEDELYVHYQRHHGVTVLRVEERLTAIAAPPEAALRLEVAEGSPLLAISRVAFDVLDQPVEHRATYLRTDALRYAVELR